MHHDLAINVAFPPKRSDPVQYYTRMFDLMERAQVRVFRLWFSDFSFNYYAWGGREHAVGLSSLERIVSEARGRGLSLIPVLFDFNEFSETNVHWKEYDHTFRSSFLSSVLARPMEFFVPHRLELGLGKFRKMREILGDSVCAWELFNEIDQVQNFSLQPAAAWANMFACEMGRTGSPDVYLSFSDPSYADQCSRLAPQVRIGLHTYGWPYRESYKNVIYWQSRYPRNWIMEFGGEHASSDEVLIALLASYVLNADGRVAMPWYWDSVLSGETYVQFRRLAEFVDQSRQQVANFAFVGCLGALATPNGRGIVRTLKLTGVRGAIRKGRAFFEARDRQQSLRPGLVFQSCDQLLAVQAPGLTTPAHLAGATRVASINVGSVEVVAHTLEC